MPVVGDADPLSIDAMERGRALAAELCGDDRVLIQGHAVPDVGPLDAALGGDGRRRRAPTTCARGRCTRTRPAAGTSTTTTRRRPPSAAAFLQPRRDTGVPVVAVHKGLSGGNPFASPVDIGPAAAANPDLAFLVYHSGYESGHGRGSLRPRRRAASTGSCAASPRPASGRRQRLRRARLDVADR